MTKRASVQTPDITASRGAMRAVPECPCGFTGHAGEESSPYIYCGDARDSRVPRDPARHQRQPVGAGVRP